jgi:hypothetical protein
MLSKKLAEKIDEWPLIWKRSRRSVQTRNQSRFQRKEDQMKNSSNQGEPMRKLLTKRNVSRSAGGSVQSIKSSASWTLPSGQRLAEYVLQTGFLAPLLFGKTLKSPAKDPNGTGSAFLRSSMTWNSKNIGDRSLLSAQDKERLALKGV